MVEYRHNPEWGVMFFGDTSPKNLKYNIESYAKKKMLGDIEVIDTNMTSTWSDEYEELKHDILVFYRPLKKIDEGTPSEVKIVE